MASEWVGVAGTALGAGIGGLVTVASLLISTRHDARARREAAVREDEHRHEERVVVAKTQQFEARRELYTSLLSAADDVRVVVRMTLDMSKHGRSLGSVDGFEKVENFRSVAAATELMSYEAVIAAITRTYVDAATSFFFDVAWGVKALKDPGVDDLRSELSEACRRDLGYETS